MNNFIVAAVVEGHLCVTCRKCGSLFERHNACTDACDMNVGPCACGGWHHNEHICNNCLHAAPLDDAKEQHDA